MRVDRRGFLAAGAALAVAPRGSASAAPPALPAPGSGGARTPAATIARLGRELGGGDPACFVDLAALDANARRVAAVAASKRMALRPALKTFQSPLLGAYVLSLLPQPRGMIFDLGQVDATLAAAPANTDLLTGWAPTLGELRAYLRRPEPTGTPPHRLRFMVDGLGLLRELVALARATPRPLPLEVCLQLESGTGRGGLKNQTEIRQACELLRAEAGRLRLTAVLCYDGHATLAAEAPYRRLVAAQAEAFFTTHLRDLRRHGADLYDGATLVRNGPASSNYRNWTAGGPANECSPGSAYLFARYLDAGFDQAGLQHALVATAPVQWITSDHPSVPLLQTTVPGAGKEEVLIYKGGEGAASIVHPRGMSDDQASGGGGAYVAPKGALRLGDHVAWRPTQTGDAIMRFSRLHALRDGAVVASFPTLARPG